MEVRPKKTGVMNGGNSQAAAGEDGDFVQLRVVRERRKMSEETQRIKRISDDTLRALSEPPKEEVRVRPTTAHKNRTVATLRIELFDALKDEDKTKIVELTQKIKTIASITDESACDPETGQNILHAAVDMRKHEMAKFIITHADVELLKSTFNVKQSGIHGKSNALHLITEQNDKEMASHFLSRLETKQNRHDAIKQETAVDIQGQRPRLFSCLHLAAYYGHRDLVRLYLDEGIDVNHLNGKKDTPLLWAARWGHNDAVNLLLDSGADTEISNDKGSTALYWAVRYEHVKTVGLLLQHGQANPNTTRKLGLVAPLVVAAAYGNNDIIKLLLQHPDTDIGITIRGGEMAIHHAAREGNVEVIQTLLEHGAAVDAKDELGDTPLLLAAQNSHVDIVDVLLENGANVTIRNHEGHDAWFYAIDSETNELLEALVVSQGGHTLTGRPPLCVAASIGRCDKIEFLLKMQRLDPLARDLDGNTFLHHAAMNNQHDVIEKFHKNISVDTQNKRGNTPLHVACYKGFHDTVLILLKCKAKADVKNVKGESPLHVAAYSKYICADTARELVDYTIKSHSWDSLNAKDYKGNNCLHVAGESAKPDVLWEFRFVRFKDRDQDGNTPLHDAVRPGKPEILHTMLDIFETMKRDARINEQNYNRGETVLHLAAKQCLTDCVKRLIDLGADLSLKDNQGNTVLHHLTEATVNDPQREDKYMEVLDVVLANIVKWWCIKKSIDLPEEDNKELYQQLKRDATLYIIHEELNREGTSVIGLAFKLGAPRVLERLLMIRNVTMFENEDKDAYHFDVTNLTPKTSNTHRGCCGNSQVSPTGGLSGMEWLITHAVKTRAAHILDLPPIRLVEQHYTSMVAVYFAVVMVVHIVYMAIFTYVGVDLLGKLRDNPQHINENDPETLLMYIIVPLEPAIIIIFVAFTLVRYVFTGDITKRSKMSRKSGLVRIANIISSYMYIIVCLIFAVLVFAWIGLLSVRYEYQDYVLAAALIMGWLLTISFTRGFRLIHYFYRMLLSMILRDIVRFIIVYLFILLAFGFALHVLFQVSSNVAAEYPSPGDTLFLVFNLMIGMGELFTDTLQTDMNAVGRNVTYLKVIYITYMILGTIIMLNLLIAMMNDSYANILREQQVSWRIESVTLGVEIDNTLPAATNISRTKIHRGQLGVNFQGDKAMDRWYVTMAEADFLEYSRMKSKTESEKNEGLAKRLERLEQKAEALEAVTQTKLNEITELLKGHSQNHRQSRPSSAAAQRT